MIRIVQLYPRDMNLYGDWGNARVLQKRLEWRGIDAEIVDHNPGDDTDLGSGDIFLGGGGQDEQHHGTNDTHASTLRDPAPSRRNVSARRTAPSGFDSLDWPQPNQETAT